MLDDAGEAFAKKPRRFGLKSVQPRVEANRVVGQSNGRDRAVSAQRMPGLTMVLIRDPDVALFSFFAITVSNGESITLLTDRQRTAHPDHKFMTRRPDRTFAERADRHWFPYHLMGVEVTPDQKGLYATQVKALVPVDATGARIGTIREFEPETFVWTVLLMELVRQQYGHQNHQLLTQ